jgi:hypothetical protein
MTVPEKCEKQWHFYGSHCNRYLASVSCVVSAHFNAVACNGHAGGGGGPREDCSPAPVCSTPVLLFPFLFPLVRPNLEVETGTDYIFAGAVHQAKTIHG